MEVKKFSAEIQPVRISDQDVIPAQTQPQPGIAGGADILEIGGNFNALVPEAPVAGAPVDDALDKDWDGVANQPDPDVGNDAVADDPRDIDWDGFANPPDADVVPDAIAADPNDVDQDALPNPLDPEAAAAPDLPDPDINGDGIGNVPQPMVHNDDGDGILDA